MRVLHVPDSVGGHAPALARAERELGLESRCVSFEPSVYGYEVDEVLRRPGESRARFEWRRLELLGRALREYDVVHFNFGSTILPMPARGPGARRAQRAYARLAFGLDLRLLSRLGKGLVVTFQGDDARQGDVLRRSYERSFAIEVAPDYYTAAGDEAKRRIIRAFDRYAHALLYLNPDLARVLPPRARFVPYASVDPRLWVAALPQREEPPLVIHAPSHRGVKGTRFVLEAIAALRDSGKTLRFELLEGRSRAEVRAAIERADIVVDQLLGGWYGGLAVEAMALGVPVVANLRDADLGVLPAAMRGELPVVAADPGDLVRVLGDLVAASPLDRGALGARSRAYVERWHDPSQIAVGMRAIYERALVGR